MSSNDEYQQQRFWPENVIRTIISDSKEELEKCFKDMLLYHNCAVTDSGKHIPWLEFEEIYWNMKYGK